MKRKEEGKNWHRNERNMQERKRLRVRERERKSKDSRMTIES